MTTILKAMRIVDTSDQDLGSPWTDAWNGTQARGARIFFADRFEPFDDRVELLRQLIHLSQFDIEFAFPEFIGQAFLQGLTK